MSLSGKAIYEFKSKDDERRFNFMHKEIIGLCQEIVQKLKVSGTLVKRDGVQDFFNDKLSEIFNCIFGFSMSKSIKPIAYTIGDIGTVYMTSLFRTIQIVRQSGHDVSGVLEAICDQVISNKNEIYKTIETPSDKWTVRTE